MSLMQDCRHALPLSLLAAALVLIPTAARPATPENKQMAADPLHVDSAPLKEGAALPDGLHDFDFLIGDWRAHLKKRLNPLTGSNTWVEYNGTSRTRKLWDDRANAEEFEVDSPESKLHIKGQTLRLYNPTSHQWSIYLVFADKGDLEQPPVVGQFRNGIGEFYDQEIFGGRAIFVRYQWFPLSPGAARMEQSFSADAGKSWEVNWICTLSRDKA